MTVGIAFTNGLEAIVVTDSRTSGWGRQSDSVNKMGNFSANNYSGVVFGSGSANQIERVLQNLGVFHVDKFDDYVSKVHQFHKSVLDMNDQNYLDSLRIEIEKKAVLIQNPDERTGFIRQSISDAMKDYDNGKRNKDNVAYLVAVAFDNERSKIRMYAMDPFTAWEVNSYHMEIGSGSDGANIYLATKLQGVDSTQLSVADLLFFTLNAYSTATVNQGVGGTPKIARISKEGCTIINPERTIALANMSGAYLSEFPVSVHDRASMRLKFGLVLSSDKPPYDKIAKEIGLSDDTLVSTYIPYSSWQERSNRKLFGGTKS